MQEEKIATLRSELDEIDRNIMESVARRMSVVQKIGRLKATGGSPVRDRSRELEIIRAMRDQAWAAGVEPDVAESLYEVLFSASRTLQGLIPRSSQEERKSKIQRKFLIVGGGGQMGRLFRRELEARGHTVSQLEKDDGQEMEPAVKAADIVMIAVPMEAAADVAAAIAPVLRKDALLCDINSLKRDVCEAMSSTRGEVLGTHPMFGPSVRSFKGQKMVLCSVKPGPLTTWFADEMTQLGLDIIEADPLSHDRMMATVQVLVHFRTLAMGEALRRSGVPIADSLAFTSPIYRLELAVVGRLFAQDPELYAEIEMQNPFGDEFRELFLNAVKRFAAIISSGDRAAFRDLFNEIGEWLSGFRDESMELSDTLIDVLITRSYLEAR